MVEIILITFVLLIAAGSAYQAFSLFCAWEFFTGNGKEICPPSFMMPVSVIKPLKGIDPEFRENLRSFCRQEYPEYEVLLGFSEPNERAIKRLRENIIPFIDSSVRVVVTSENLGPNRKVSNLQGLMDAARYPLLAMSDSDMRVDPSYLRDIVGEYYCSRNPGLVTCLYKISDPRTIGTALESLTIALDFTPSVLVARRLEGITFGLGASMLVSKKALADIGGLRTIAGYLADDYQIGHRLWEKGYSVVLSRIVIENVAGRMSITEYLNHQVRWARTYRASRPKGFLGYGITHIVPFALLLLVLDGLSAPALFILGAVLSLRLGIAAVIYKKVMRSKQWLKWLPLLPIKDVLSFCIWAWSLMSNTVTWRGRSYKILKEGKIVEAGAP